MGMLWVTWWDSMKDNRKDEVMAMPWGSTKDNGKDEMMAMPWVLW